MSDVFAAAADLADAIVTSPEGKRFVEAREQLNSHPDSYRLVQDFFPKQLSIQSRRMMGVEIPQDEVTAFNALATSVMSDPVVAEYLQSQMLFMPIYEKIVNIIGEAVGIDPDLLGFFK